MARRLCLTVNGSGFVSSSLVKWNGAALPTTFVSSGQLKAVVHSAVGDFNGDGRLDLAVTNFYDNTLSMGNGEGTFQPAVTYAVGNAPASVAVGDLNGDGKLDLTVANFSDNTVSVLLGNGDSTFTSASGAPSKNAADYGRDIAVFGPWLTKSASPAPKRRRMKHLEVDPFLARDQGVGGSDHLSPALANDFRTLAFAVEMNSLRHRI